MPAMPQVVNPIELEEPEQMPQAPEDAGAFDIAPSSILLAKLAVLLRRLQLFSHAAHNLVSGPNFFANHSFLGELYLKYESLVDDVTERMIGTGPSPNLVLIQQRAVSELTPVPPTAEGIFSELLQGEKELQAMCEQFEGKASMGTVNMVAGISDESEVRAYKLQQTLGGQQPQI